MKKILALLCLLGFILLAWLSWQWYHDNVLCCNDSNTTQQAQQDAENQAAIDAERNAAITALIGESAYTFNWGDATPNQNNYFKDLLARMKDGMVDGKKLTINSPYYASEVNNTEYPTIGIARAEAIKKALAGEFPEDRMVTNSYLRTLDADKLAMNYSFGGTKWNWYVNNDNVKEVDGKTVLYFGSGSANKIENTNVTNYLKDMAKVMIDSGRNARITGHTDTTGDAAINQGLSLKRAESVKNTLISYGVPAGQILTEGKGESMPIHTNDDTAQKRAENRRAEFELLDN